MINKAFELDISNDSMESKFAFGKYIEKNNYYWHKAVYIDKTADIVIKHKTTFRWKHCCKAN